MSLRHFLLPLLATFIEASSAHSTGSSLTVGTASAPPSIRANGVIHVPAGVDDACDIPVIVIRGRMPGPTIALIAGLHGTEFGGIVSLSQLADRIDPAKVSGSIIILPVINVASFHGLVRHVNPVDGKNINRMFPGDPRGTQSQRIAAMLTHDVLSIADYVIDYHNGDIDEDQIPYSYWIVTHDQAIDAKEHAMLMAYAAPYIVRYDDAEPAASNANMLPTQAVARGKPTITVEAGRAGTYTADDLRMTIDGTERVLAKLGILDKSIVPSSTQPVLLSGSHTVASEATGIFYPEIKRGDRLVKGQRLGRIVDFYGQTLAEPVTPSPGVVLYLAATPSVVKGEQLVFIGLTDVE